LFLLLQEKVQKHPTEHEQIQGSCRKLPLLSSALSPLHISLTHESFFWNEEFVKVTLEKLESSSEEAAMTAFEAFPQEHQIPWPGKIATTFLWMPDHGSIDEANCMVAAIAPSLWANCRVVTAWPEGGVPLSNHFPGDWRKKTRGCFCSLQKSAN